MPFKFWHPHSRKVSDNTKQRKTVELMEDEEAGLPKLSKRFSDKGGEVDFKTKSGTAWSHNFLNQKPWHPLSYPNQRRKWIAEQTHAQRQRRTEEVSREYAQEQDFLRQASLLSQREKEKVDLMQAVSFMYVRPPGYNAESAKAAEIVEEKRKLGEIEPAGATSSSVPQENAPVKEEKKKPRPKDVFGRSLPTEEEFAVLKNAPRLETGVAGRAKPFAVEVRNVKCVRCANYGHQSGDRECPLKDAIMPNEESRLKRDDPLTAIMAQMDSSEPLKWELKQKPGISPPRGGFQPDDPNQQIVAEDIFDEYGGFLSGGNIPELLTNFSSKKHKKKTTKSKSKHKKRQSSRSSCEDGSSSSDNEKRSAKKQASTRARHEGDYGRTSSKKRMNKKRPTPTDCDEDSHSSSSDNEKRSAKKQASTRARHEGDYGRTSSKKRMNKKRPSPTDCDSHSSSSDNEKRSAKKQASTRAQHEGDYGRTSSKKRMNKKRPSPTDCDEDSHSDEYYRKSRKDFMPKRERNKKSLSHFSMSDGSSDERYHTKSRNDHSHQADDMDLNKYSVSHRGCKEFRKSDKDELHDSERKLSSKGKRLSHCAVSEKLESDRYRRRRQQ